MKIDVRFKVEGDILVVIPSGAIKSKEDVLAYVESFTSEAEARGCNKILCEEKNISVEVDVLDVVEVINHLVDTWYHLKGLRVASVNPSNSDLSYTAELLAANNSMSYKAYCDRAAAVVWLSTTLNDQARRHSRACSVW